MTKQHYVLFAIESIGNTGDEIIAETSEWLLQNTGALLEGTLRCQLIPGYKDMVKHYKLCVCALPFKYFARLFKGNMQYRIMNIMYRIKYKRYFNDIIKNSDKIVLSVGMFKFATQDLSYSFDMITEIASKYNKPLLMSAMSIAKPDVNDWRYHQLVRAVNRSCVKMITSRDGESGLERLNKYYVQHNQRTDYVGDPALWIPECYHVQKNNGDVIGVNVIRKGIYSAYGNEMFSDDKMMNLYKEIINELEVRGHKWVLFCNGMELDYQVGEQIISELSLPKNKLLPRPNSGKELVEMISSFKAVFGARLHACITSVSLGVPVSGLLWDDNLRFFSRTMKISQFFSEINELKGCKVVDKIEAAMEYRLDVDNIKLYKDRTLMSIKEFVGME